MADKEKKQQDEKFDTPDAETIAAEVEDAHEESSRRGSAGLGTAAQDVQEGRFEDPNRIIQQPPKPPSSGAISSRAQVERGLRPEDHELSQPPAGEEQAAATDSVGNTDDEADDADVQRVESDEDDES